VSTATINSLQHPATKSPLLRASRSGAARGLQRPSPDGLLVTRVGLRIVNALAFDVWALAGSKLIQAHNSSAWCLGDWIIYGQSRYESRYREAVDATGLDYRTIRNYAWVSRRFELSRRRENLSFQHHAEVAALPEHEQDRWLDEAEQAGWSRNALRRRLRDSRGETKAAPGSASLRGVAASSEQVERWRGAAANTGMSLDAWILSRLDQAAREDAGSRCSDGT
jgi:hypothetical protein